MIKTFIVFVILFSAELTVSAQINMRLTLPKDTLVNILNILNILNIETLTCSGFWTHYKNGEITIRKGDTERYLYNKDGNIIERLTLSGNDSTVLEKWVYEYNEDKNLVEFKQSRYGDTSVVSKCRILSYESLRNGWKSKEEIDSSIMNSKNYPASVDYSKEFSLVINNILLVDSVVRQYNSFPIRTYVQYYFYKQDGKLDYITNKVVSKYVIREGIKYFRYDEKNRLVEIFEITNGKKRSLQKWKRNDATNEVKIYSRSYRNRRQIEYFKYDAKNRLIKYSKNLNDKILRVYEFSYYDNDLIRELITIAPKENWTHTQNYEYLYR